MGFDTRKLVQGKRFAIAVICTCIAIEKEQLRIPEYCFGTVGTSCERSIGITSTWRTSYPANQGTGEP